LGAVSLNVGRWIHSGELYVRRVTRGGLGMSHDRGLQRRAGIDAVVWDVNHAELRQLDVGSHKDHRSRGARIPLLSELFSRHGRSLYYDVELKVRGTKDTGIARKTWELIRSHGLEDRCLVSSFNPFAIRRFNAVSHNAIPTAVIYCEDEEVPRILQHGWGRHIARATVLKPEWIQVNGPMMNRFSRRKGYPVLVWTVDEKEKGLKLLEQGVEGLISNDPSLFLADQR